MRQVMTLIRVVMARTEARCDLRIISQMSFQIKIWTFEIFAAYLGETGTGTRISI